MGSIIVPSLVSTTVHFSFLLSFIVPAIYIASARDSASIRRSKSALWLGLAFAVPTTVACLLLSASSVWWLVYPALYAVFFILPGAVRLGRAPRVDAFRSGEAEVGDGREGEDKAAHRDFGLARRERGLTRGDEICCESRLIASSGSNASDFRQGSAGTWWLLGSNYYSWTLSVEVLEATDDGVRVRAAAAGIYTPWYGVTPRKADVSNSVTGVVFCRDLNGKCVARGSGGLLPRRGDVYEIAISVNPILGPADDEVVLEVNAVASVEGDPVIEKIDLAATAGGAVAGVKVGGRVGFTIKIRSEARAHALVSRNYNYRCVPCEHKPASADVGSEANSSVGASEALDNEIIHRDCAFKQTIGMYISNGPVNGQIDVHYDVLIDGADSDSADVTLDLDADGKFDGVADVEPIVVHDACRGTFEYGIRFVFIVRDEDGIDISPQESDQSERSTVINCNEGRPPVRVDVTTQVGSTKVDTFITLDEFECV